jgi:hypothetical protein
MARSTASPASGKPEVFFEPKTKYIWSLAFDAAGNLYVATGDPGEIYRVAPDGKGAVFFHARRRTCARWRSTRSGNLIVGTEPRGLVLRVSPAGDGFVLYQTPKREVTAVAVGGRWFDLRGSGVRQAGASARLRARRRLRRAPRLPTFTVNAPGTAAPARGPARRPPRSLGAPAGVSGGSEVYRIEPDGNPRARLEPIAQDVVYAIAFDAAGRAVLGTGNQGRRVPHRIAHASPRRFCSVPATQVTAFSERPRRPSLRGHRQRGQAV